MIQDIGLVSIVHMPMLGLLPRARCASSVVEAIFGVTTSDWENPHYLLIAAVQLQMRLLSHVHAGKNRKLTVVKYDGDDKLMAMSWKTNHTSGDEYVHTVCCLVIFVNCIRLVPEKCSFEIFNSLIIQSCVLVKCYFR